jgi:hypothetical protein
VSFNEFSHEQTRVMRDAVVKAVRLARDGEQACRSLSVDLRRLSLHCLGAARFLSIPFRRASARFAGREGDLLAEFGRAGRVSGTARPLHANAEFSGGGP